MFPRAIIGSLVAAAMIVLAAGCGGDEPDPRPSGPVDYDAGRPLAPQVTAVGQRGPMKVSAVRYRSFDDAEVPALLAVPADPVACLVYMDGVGAKKEDAERIWPGAAELGFATFTIDARLHGERGTPEELEQAKRDPRRLAALFRETVIDLRRGLDLLEDRPECLDRPIGYLGISLGGVVGAILAGADDRIAAAVLMSVGANWRTSLETSDVLLPGIEDDPDRLAAALKTLAPYDPGRWAGRIAPRPLLLVDGRKDPVVAPSSVRELLAAAGEPKRLIWHTGGHDPFTAPPRDQVFEQVAEFLQTELG